MPQEKHDVLHSSIDQRNGRTIQTLSYSDGLREERQLDASGIANGDYDIYRGDKCIESGTFKNGKRDGESEQYDEDGNLKSVMFYKDGKERKIMNALAKLAAALNRFVKKSEEQNNQELLKYRVQGYVLMQSIKDLFGKLLPFKRDQKTVIPEEQKNKEGRETSHKSNHELLSTHSSRLRKTVLPRRQIKSEQTFSHPQMNITQLARLSSKGSHRG